MSTPSPAAAAAPVPKTVWIVTWAGSVTSGSAINAMTLAQKNVASSVKTTPGTFDIYVPATDDPSARAAATAYAATAAITLSGDPTAVVNTGATVTG